MSTTNISSNNISVDIANREDEFRLPNDNNDNSHEHEEKLVIQTRSRRISRPCNWAEKFPKTAHLQEEHGRWIIPYYYNNDDMRQRL